jgi:hypothetical protein
MTSPQAIRIHRRVRGERRGKKVALSGTYSAREGSWVGNVVVATSWDPALLDVIFLDSHLRGNDGLATSRASSAHVAGLNARWHHQKIKKIKPSAFSAISAVNNQ